MIWMTWRQFRSGALVSLGLFLVLAAVLGYTGPHLVHLYQQSGITACQSSGGDCGPLIDAFTAHYPVLHNLSALVLILPLIVGVFSGAPLLARELETGTHKVAWMQTVSRSRWLTTKILIVGVGSVALTALFTVAIGWWFSPLDTVNANRFNPTNFDERGLVPIAYAAFAFTLGLVLGVIIRRSLPAMAATLLVFVAVRFLIEDYVRPHFATALQVISPVGFRVDSTAIHPNDWVVATRTVNAAGHTIPADRGFLRTQCAIPDGDFSRTSLQTCAQRLGIHTISTVQPAHRYWGFQLWEAAIFIALAIVLTLVTYWWTRTKIR
jgi:hypothetical protein